MVRILCTLCFLSNSALAVHECSRILLPNGRLVASLIPRLSFWGQKITLKKRRNDLFYRHARLFTISDTAKLLELNGFTVIESWSILRQPPANAFEFEKPVRSMNENSELSVLAAKKWSV